MLRRPQSLFTNTLRTLQARPSQPYHQVRMASNDQAPVQPPTNGEPTLDQTPTPGANEPPTKSALKKLEKQAKIAAAKAANAVGRAAPAGPKDGAKKKEKPVAVVVEEPPFIEVPKGHKKGMQMTYPFQ